MKRVHKTGLYDYNTEDLEIVVNDFMKNHDVLSVDYRNYANQEWAYITYIPATEIEKTYDAIIEGLEEKDEQTAD